MKYYLKFCQDFSVPGSKIEWIEVYRRKVKRETVYLDYDTFKDCLLELFKLSIEQKLLAKEKDFFLIQDQIRAIKEENKETREQEYKAKNAHSHVEESIRMLGYQEDKARSIDNADIKALEAKEVKIQ